VLRSAEAYGRGGRLAAAAFADLAADAAISGPYFRPKASTALRWRGDILFQTSYAAKAIPTVPVRRSLGTPASSHTDGSSRRPTYC
jgi:hypothetical protein